MTQQLRIQNEETGARSQEAEEENPACNYRVL